MSEAGLEELPLARTRRRLRFGVVAPLASLAILVLGWSALWGVAAWQAGLALDGALASEARAGRVWTCGNRSLSGYPFRIALDCQGVTFAGVVDGSPAEGRLGALHAVTTLYEPSSIALDLGGPMVLSSRDGRIDLRLSWAALRGTIRGFVGGLKRLELEADAPSLIRQGQDLGRADHVELHAGPATGLPIEDAADTIELLAAGVSVPTLDGLTGETAPLDASVSAVVTRAFGNLPDLGTATVERWRAAGGRVDLSDLTVTKGPFAAALKGRLGLDDAHRLSGQLTASLSGFEPLARRFGIPLGAVEIGSALTRLLGAAPAPAAKPGTVEVPVILADGALRIGPFRAPLHLQPLY